MEYGGDGSARDLLLHHGPALAGYSYLGGPDSSGHRSGELVIHPAHRRRGLGRALAGAAVAEASPLPVRIWAHGDLPAAARLAAHAGFTRAHLLQEVWGYDYFGGTRTVDVHVRRLRAKLGAEHESLIGTVRNVGYRFVPLKAGEDSRRSAARAGPTATEPRAVTGQSATTEPHAGTERPATTEPPAGAQRPATTEPHAGDGQSDDGKAGGLVPGNVRGG